MTALKSVHRVPRTLARASAIAIASMGLFAGTALAGGVWSGQVTISPGGTYNRSGQAWYDVLACPVATFGVSTSIGVPWGSSAGIGDAAFSVYPCVTNDYFGGVSSGTFSIGNGDSSNSRTFNVYAYYS